MYGLAVSATIMRISLAKRRVRLGVEYTLSSSEVEAADNIIERNPTVSEFEG